MSEKVLLNEAVSLLRDAVQAISAGGDRAGEAEVVELLGLASDVSRAADGLRVAITGVVSRRSEGLSRAEALCSRLGFRSTKALVSQAFGVQAGAAETLVTLAQATGPRTGFSSGDLPPFRPALAAALRAGEISADQAIAVHRGLPHPGVAESQPGMTEAAERFLVDGATGGRVGFDEAGRPVITHGDPTRGNGSGPETGGSAAAERPGDGPTPDGAAAGPDGSGDSAGPAVAGGAPGVGGPSGAGDGTFWNIPGVTPAGGATTVGTRRRTDSDMDVWGPRRMEPHLVRVQAGAWRDAIDPDGAAPREGEQVQRRSFKVLRAAGGGWRLTGYAPEQAGAALAHFMDVHTGPQAHPDRFLDPTGEHSGPVVDLPVPAGSGRPVTSGQGSEDRRTPEQKGFDALHSLVESQQRQQDESGPGGSGATLVVTVTMSALDRYARSLGGVGNAAELPGLGAWAAAQQPPVPGGVGRGVGGGAVRPGETGQTAGGGRFAAPGEAALMGDGIGGRLSGQTSQLGQLGQQGQSGQLDQAGQTGWTGQASPTGCLAGPGPSALGVTLDGLFASHSRSDEVVPMSTVAAMLCTDALRLVVTDEAGTAVRLGRQQRPFSKAQRQALAARDRHCRAPGCLAPPSWCHTHHVIPWSVGGHTNLDNAIVLCSFHHHELHRGRLGVVPSREVGAMGHPWAVLSVWHLRRLAAETRESAERSCTLPSVAAPPRVGRAETSAWCSREGEWTLRLPAADDRPSRRRPGPVGRRHSSSQRPRGEARAAAPSRAVGTAVDPAPPVRLPDAEPTGCATPGVLSGVFDLWRVLQPGRGGSRAVVHSAPGRTGPRRTDLRWHPPGRIRLAVDARGRGSP